MPRVKFGQNQVDLQNEIINLKRQLTITLDENHLLKVKIRRLENEIRKKDKYIDYFFIKNREQSFDNRRIIYEKTSNAIQKLKKENDDLKEMILKRDIEDQKREYDIKRMLLYGQTDKTYRKPSRKSSHSLNHDLPGVKKLESLSDSNTISKNVYRTFAENLYNLESTKDYLNSLFTTRADVEKLVGTINNLKEQQDIDRKIIHARDSEIIRLASELNEIKEQLSIEKISSSLSPIVKHDYGNSKNKKFDRSKRCTIESAEFESSHKPKDIKVERKPMKHKTSRRLEPVWELSENELSSASDKSERELYNEDISKKTEIEYIIDSEVSSDGEDIYLLNNLGSYHRKTIGTMSNN
ncbi:uncharacterized protein LOC130664652 [Microplitis mediator]|uniref:uncharacterized protein LOC130664652 n=1 Tax=Microplitis mediator TaxID=375433 RepID=UPI002552D71D|nr:uncharacterized protein LOC130664652 [Microplitis mediator]